LSVFFDIIIRAGLDPRALDRRDFLDQGIDLANCPRCKSDQF